MKIMENKLEQLTQKLRSEGLERGRTEAEAMISEAEAKAKQIVESAKSDAEKIVTDAKLKAEELSKNSANDVRMACEQTISALRAEIAEMVLAHVVDGVVGGAWQNGDFVKQLIVEAVKSWNPSQESGVEVVVNDQMVGEIQAVINEHFKHGVEVSASSRVRVPFRIAPKEGGYYVSFTDEDFSQLIKDTLRPKVSEFLFAK